MPFRNNNVTREDLIRAISRRIALSRRKPTPGLTAQNCGIEGRAKTVWFCVSIMMLPRRVHFRRQYNALKRLPSDVVPDPRFFKHGWMAVEFLAGEIKSSASPMRQRSRACCIICIGNLASAGVSRFCRFWTITGNGRRPASIRLSGGRAEEGCVRAANRTRYG